MIAIIDYSTGNLCSVKNALKRLGASFEVTSDHGAIRAASHVILPGVGEAGGAMARLRERGLVEVIRSLNQPVLGICIGVQLMCRSSEEGDTECMGIFDSQVKKFTDPKLKVPHIGWNTVSGLSTPLFKGIAEGTYVYYVHSYAPTLGPQTVAVTDYGIDFSGALNRDNFYGTQFHPEKSGDVGEQILKNFLNL